MRSTTPLIVFILISMIKASSSQDMAQPSDDASILLSALCVHDNRIRESCLQNGRMKSLITDLLMSLGTQIRSAYMTGDVENDFNEFTFQNKVTAAGVAVWKERRMEGLAARVKMGKKVEKAVSKEKNHSSASHETLDEDPNKTPEPYKCTGNFQADFTELCRRISIAVIPPVILRPHAPAPVVQEIKIEKVGKEKGGKQVIPEPEPEVELNEDGVPVEPPPKTFTTKEKHEYFKPCIHVEMEHPEKNETVTEIFIRGWKIDMAMMEIFQMCWPPLDKLHTINLWRVGLTGDTLHHLATFLPLCANLKNLTLDNNPVKEENFYELIGEESNIQNLSLRYCSITNVGAHWIGMVLGTSKMSNSKLLSLNLSGNLIGDEGAAHIANGLKMNRTLMSLSLNNNKIGDKGAIKLAEALSRFPLLHEEVVERRRLLSDRGSPDRNKSLRPVLFGVLAFVAASESDLQRPPPSRRADSKDRPGSVRSTVVHTDKDKKTRDKPSAKKKDTKAATTKDEAKGGKTKEKEDTRASSKKGSPGNQVQATIAADGGKTLGGKTKDKRKDKKAPSAEPEVDLQEAINPLLEVADLIEGQLWVAGNRVLINLNLSRNQIGETGLNAFLKAIQYQTTLTLDSRSSGTGLMRLCFHKNCISADNTILKKINDQMLHKDPFYKPPVAEEFTT